MRPVPELLDERPAPGGYGPLFREVRAAGLMDRRLLDYAVRVGVTWALMAATAVAFVLIGDSWWQLLTAAVVAALSAQCGFLGHDAGHGQIFTSRRANDVLGYLHGDLLIGLGYGWWTGKHDAHHANPNHEDLDPDVNLGILAFTTAQSGTERGPLGRFVIRHQSALFFPMLLLEGLDLHVTAVQTVLRRAVPFPRTEGVLLIVHMAVYLGALFTVLSPGLAVLFVVVHQALFGLYLGCSFAPGHKGMPMLTADDALDPLRKQVLTSRNIVGSRLIDVAMGGLNFQIEHHLFPRMPRANLRRARPLVQAACRREAIPYLETSFAASYARVLRHLHEVSAPARAGVART